MKKACILTAGLLLVSAATAFASPQTDIEKGKTSVDIGAFNSKTALGGYDLDTKTTLDAGITTGISNKIALQYKYHNLKAEANDVQMQELNALYKLTPNTDAFVGVNRFSGNLTGDDYNSKNKLQVGITTTVPLGTSLNAWGTVAAGDDLVNCELGISHPLTENADFNVYYRYTKEDNATFKNGGALDFENNGFGLGVTLKF